MSVTVELKMLAAGLCGAALVGCGGGSGGSGASDGGEGTLSLAVTDAPVDNVAEVWVQFAGVRVKPRTGEAIDVTFDTPLDIDLLTLTGKNSASLLNGEPMPAGAYDWIALAVNAELDTVFDSYAVGKDGTWVEIRVPSGSQQGLRLVSGFTITANQNTSFVIDWDLRKGLTDPEGQDGMFLRPALRIVDMTEHGSIRGTVADPLLSGVDCANDPGAGTGNLVYVYEGADEVPVDISGGDADPVATGLVTQNAQAAGAYTYAVAFLSPGEYTVAFTCQGAAEDPEADDGLAFSAPQNAVVADGEDTVVDFE